MSVRARGTDSTGAVRYIIALPPPLRKGGYGRHLCLEPSIIGERGLQGSGVPANETFRLRRISIKIYDASNRTGGARAFKASATPRHEASTPQSIRLLADHRTEGSRLAGTQMPRVRRHHQHPLARIGKGRGHDNAKHGEPQTNRNYRGGITAIASVSGVCSIWPTSLASRSRTTRTVRSTITRRRFSSVYVRGRADEIIAHARTNSENIHDFRWEADGMSHPRGDRHPPLGTKARRRRARLSGGSVREPVDGRSAEGSGLHVSATGLPSDHSRSGRACAQVPFSRCRIRSSRTTRRK